MPVIDIKVGRSTGFIYGMGNRLGSLIKIFSEFENAHAIELTRIKRQTNELFWYQ
jgi:hypothetical protein